MKKISAVVLSLTLMVLLFTSCSSITGGGPGNNEELYKAAVERYYNSIIKLDIDTFLDSLDPLGPLYPDSSTIEQLRDEAAKNTPDGKAEVKETTIIEESGTRATVKVALFLSIDFAGDGEFVEETFYPTFDLTLKDGVWRVFNGTMAE